jgi:hypothetical protein
MIVGEGGIAVDGLYLYGMADNLDWRKHEIFGIAQAFPIYGIDIGSVCAVVSDVPLDEYGAQPLEQRVNDMSWLKQKAELHMAILCSVMSFSPLIPAKFCTVSCDRDKLVNTVKPNVGIIQDYLERLRGKAEWSCKVYVDDDEYMAYYMKQADNSGIAKLSPGTAYFRRKQLERDIFGKADGELAKTLSELLSKLRETALDVCMNRILPKEITQRREKMMLNTSLLVDESARTAVALLVDAENNRMNSAGVFIELTGPWPPFDFSPELKKDKA